MLGLIGDFLYLQLDRGFFGVSVNSSTTKFIDHGEAVVNPLMGYAPPADNMEAVGDNTLVYVEITWKDWEPEKNQYDIEKLEKQFNLNTWKNSGKRVVLRFVCDIPGKDTHKDIPDWLYEKTDGDGMWYDNSYGKGYAPNYADTYFIERHKMAIEALGNYYGQDSFIAYVELGSLGHWGEWHVAYSEGLPRIPDEQTCTAYIQPYLDAFPNAKLLMRRPFQWVSEYGMGVYNDMSGDTESTLEWLDWINYGGDYTEPIKSWKLMAIPRIWEKSPVGGEFTSSKPMKNMIVNDLDVTQQLLKKSHMTFIGPKTPVTASNVKGMTDQINTVLKSIGYRYIIKKSMVKLSETGRITVILDWENTGVAPMYWDWPVFLYLLDDNGDITYKQEVDMKLTSLLPGRTLTTETVIESNNVLKKDGEIGIGIEDPLSGKAVISFAMQCEKIEGISVIGSYGEYKIMGKIKKD